MPVDHSWKSREAERLRTQPDPTYFSARFADVTAVFQRR
jgi:hypothetical protein